MENNLREILKENNINLNKITLKNNVRIISTDKGNYVIKEEVNLLCLNSPKKLLIILLKLLTKY